MNFRKTGFWIITILLSLILSSCEELDHSWTTGVLDRKESLYTKDGGKIKRSFIIEDRDIFIDRRYKSIEDIRFEGYEEIIFTISRGDEINDLWLNVDGTRAELHWSGSLSGTTSFGGTEATYYFMDVLVEQIYREGFAKINVDAKNADRRNDVRLDIHLLADLEVYIRE